MRKIPAIMATQHPDNAKAPFWETDGDGYISAGEEMAELFASFKQLDADEYMWGWEGKNVDEAIVERLLTEHYDYFKKHELGKDKFLTFRVPNIWQEKGYSLARAFMSILTAADIAHDLKFNSPPLFEVILPMTTSSNQLIHIQKTFSELAKTKHRLFTDKNKQFNYLEIIPLVEGVSDMFNISKLLESYRIKHKEMFKRDLLYLRPFIARSDPALIDGLIPAVIGSKIALSEMYKWSIKHGLNIYPIIGCGSLPFRGSLAPGYIEKFMAEYRGIRTVTVQSAFRYDYNLTKVKKAIKELKHGLPLNMPHFFDPRETLNLLKIVNQSKKYYHQTILGLSATIFKMSKHVPQRRERRLHIGLLGYARKLGNKQFPRAINFTATLYSLGVPPELISTGRTLKHISSNRVLKQIFESSYINLRYDIIRAGRRLNRENLKMLAKANPIWKEVMADIDYIEKYFSITLGPTKPHDFLHRNETSNVYFKRKNHEDFSRAILEAGKLRKSLG
ncbi:MAG: phosphoenolpyruvate carboxylase [Patescibacteria group bacterium]